MAVCALLPECSLMCPGPVKILVDWGFVVDRVDWGYPQSTNKPGFTTKNGRISRRDGP
jgi:hypothetical protein